MAVAGLLDTSANGFFVAAAGEGLLSVVGVLGSLYPVVTVTLAHLHLGERIARVQQVGVALALAGVLLISAG
jgi:drug/metabolite transporter (DMT)-like permease